MNTRKPNSRRKILIGLGGGIAGASQLPKAWTKPVVDSVLLPLHAETSDDAGSGSGGLPTHFRDEIQLTPQGAALQTSNGILSFMVSEAYAGDIGPQITLADLSIDSPAGTAFTAKMLVNLGNGSVFRTANGTVNGGAVAFVDANCGFEAGTFEVTSIGESSAVYSLSVEGGTSAGPLPEDVGDPAWTGQCPIIK